MHAAVCDECGADCEVPFRPSGDKPIYCSDCFSQKRGSSGDNRGRDRSAGRSNYGDKRMYSGVCEECGADCQLPFKPSSDKPVYCSNCFDKRGNRKNDRKGNNGGGSDKELVGKITELNHKLDIIIDILSASWLGEEETELDEQLPAKKADATSSAKTGKTEKAVKKDKPKGKKKDVKSVKKPKKAAKTAKKKVAKKSNKK